MALDTHEIDWTAEPAGLVAMIEAAATRRETPSGNGSMVWHGWGLEHVERPPLVLLHGGSGSWTHWIKVIPPLARSTAVWAADLPGLGDSAMPPPPLTPATSGHVVAEGVRRLFPDGRAFHLLGFSFGAHVGTFAAVELGSQLETFTICGCAALGIPHNRLEFDRERSTMSTAESDAVHRANLGKLMIADPGRIDDLAVHVQGENIRRARFKSRAFAATGEIAENVAHVTAPLRAIWGAGDVLATPSIEARYDILRRHHPELKARTIADAGHWVAYEQPAAFVDAVRALTELPVP